MHDRGLQVETKVQSKRVEISVAPLVNDGARVLDPQVRETLSEDDIPAVLSNIRATG
jgi:hypothetical protein